MTFVRTTTELLTEIATDAKTVMEMVQAIHRMSAELTGTLRMVLTYGSMTQHNGLTLMEMDMVTMEQLEPPILISSHTILLQLMIMTQMDILIDGHHSTTVRMH